MYITIESSVPEIMTSKKKKKEKDGPALPYLKQWTLQPQYENNILKDRMDIK